MKIQHLIHSCLLVEMAGRRVLVDPGGFSGDAVRGLSSEVLSGIDVVAITHQHPDHLDRALLGDVLAKSPAAIVIAEPETAGQLAEPVEGSQALPADRLVALHPGQTHELPPLGDHHEGQETLRIGAVGGRHAVIHPDIPGVGNTGLVLSTESGPRLGVTGDSLEPVEEFHGIDVLAFAVVAPWSKIAETIDFLRTVNPKLALPVHDAVASAVGRPIYLRQVTSLAAAGTEVRDWPEDGILEL